MPLLEDITTMNNRYQEANLNAGHRLNIEELNELHPLWSKEIPRLGSSDYELRIQKVSFSKETQNRYEGDNDKREKTDFMERGDRPLCKALKLLEAAIYDRPVYKIFIGEKDKFIINAVDIIIGDILESLIKGENYRFSNASSAKVSPSPAIINKLKIAYVKFRYFNGLPPLKEPESQTTLGKKMDVLKVQPITHQPLLVRQASRSVFCSPPPIDDLEQRYLKLLGR